MTQHIDEAIERLKLLRKVGFGYDIKDEDRAAIDAVLSALAAAEERGRIEERERCAIKPAGLGVETESLQAHMVVYQTYDGELFLSKDRVLEYCTDRPYALGNMGWVEKQFHDYPCEEPLNAG